MKAVAAVASCLFLPAQCSQIRRFWRQNLQPLASQQPAGGSHFFCSQGEEDEGAAGEQRRVLDPCLPRGYEGVLDGVAVSGGGYFGLCRQVAAGIVLGTNCSSLHCGLGGMYLPPLTGEQDRRPSLLMLSTSITTCLLA